MLATSGILNLAKPSGTTSRRALDVVARLVRPTRAGHAGTLDPLAFRCVGGLHRPGDTAYRIRATNAKNLRGDFPFRPHE